MIYSCEPPNSSLSQADVHGSRQQLPSESWVALRLSDRIEPRENGVRFIGDPRRVQTVCGRTVSLTLLVHFLSLVRLQLPPGIIRCRCQLHGEFEEVLRL